MAELNGRKTQEKAEPDEKNIALKVGENKWNKNNSEFFKGKSNKCGKYGHRVSDCWGNSNKNVNINYNKTEIKPHFNGE